MNGISDNKTDRQLTDEELKHELYLKQKELLDTFLSHGAITPAQYDKSLHDLTVKMHEDPADWVDKLIGEFPLWSGTIRNLAEKGWSEKAIRFSIAQEL